MADALLHEQNRPGRTDPDYESDDQHQRNQHGKSDKDARDVQRSLPKRNLDGAAAGQSFEIDVITRKIHALGKKKGRFETSRGRGIDVAV
jgi:hypothetical protein